MIEIPESFTISQQASETLKGKTIAHIIEPNSLHRFAFYNGDPAGYSGILVGRTIQTARGHGCFVDILMDEDTHLLIGDGTHICYHTSTEKAPKKYQLMIVFEDNSFLAFTVSMYGSIYAFKGEFDNPYYQGSLHKPCPLDERFDKVYFLSIIKNLKKDLSAKALLATEQRIPGLGNGVVQDILFNARIAPKRKISTLTEKEIDRLFHTLKSTLEEMTRQGGRDTEKDLYGILGNYRTILSKNTYHTPCPACGGRIIKEAYLGGSVYYCPHCQPA
ncbi:endonuclease VIII [uncultured Parabacteroides sp.]|uniref:endonuclease VIII n=1 Tax=uncultured Parabacteroides sp. TaxID=512312 RepID=UPI00260DB057|nr:endonuclease VIII [uncultured Parabacteroides sp.]